MSAQLLQQISDNYQLALLVHRENADLMWYIGLQGWAMLHEHQYLSESLMQRRIKKYITETYHTYSPDKIPKSANIAEPLITGKNRKTFQMQDTWKIVQESWKIYQEWEESTLKLYEQAASDLLAKGDVAAFNFVNGIVKEVKEELVYVTDKIIELSAMNFDMPTIVDQQTNYLERYERLIRELLGKSQHYHRHNSALDPESRATILDKHPD